MSMLPQVSCPFCHHPFGMDAELYSEVAALLGELTVAGAFRQLAELADMDDPSWAELVAVRWELMATAPAERRAVCERLSEPTRRRVALLILDKTFIHQSVYWASPRVTR